MFLVKNHIFQSHHTSSSSARLSKFMWKFVQTLTVDSKVASKLIQTWHYHPTVAGENPLKIQHLDLVEVPPECRCALRPAWLDLRSTASDAHWTMFNGRIPRENWSKRIAFSDRIILLFISHLILGHLNHTKVHGIWAI